MHIFRRKIYFRQKKRLFCIFFNNFKGIFSVYFKVFDAYIHIISSFLSAYKSKLYLRMMFVVFRDTMYNKTTYA